MLQKLRDKTTGWIATLILGLLIIPFAFVGVNEYMTGGAANDVATVEAPPHWWKSAPSWWPVSMLWERREITLDEFRAEFEQVRAQERQAQGEDFDPREFESMENKLRVLQQLIDREVLALASAQAGIVIGNDAVARAIATEPAFQVEGQFNLERYQLLLSQQNPPLTPQAFEERQRERLGMLVIPQAIGESDFITDKEMERLLRLLGETRDVTIAMVAPPAADAAEVTDAEIKQWYDSHGSDFRQAESVTLEYVEINGAALPATAPADEATLRKRYEDEKARFVDPEQRLAAHILITVPADAEEATVKAAERKAASLAEQARGGADFAALAKAHSEDPGSKDAGGELPWVARDGSMVKPFEDAMFSMQAGEISAPVRTDYGFHVLQLRQIKAGQGRSFEEVRDELAREQAASDGERAYNELAGRVVNEVLKNPTSLTAAAEATGLAVQRVGPVARNAPVGIVAHPSVQRAAFSEALVQDGTVSDPIELAPNHSVLIRVAEHQPERAQPLEQVRDAVIAAIRADRQDKAAQAAADALLARLAKGEKLQEIASAENLQAGQLPGLQRGMQVPTQEANAAIFAAQRPADGKPSTGKVALGNGAWAVFSVDKVNEADLSAIPAEQRAMLRQQVAQMDGASATQAYIDAMRKQYKVKVMEDRL